MKPDTGYVYELCLWMQQDNHYASTDRVVAERSFWSSIKLEVLHISSTMSPLLLN